MWRFLAKLAVSCVLVGLLFWSSSPAAVIRQMLTVDPMWLVGAVVLMAAINVPAALRWSVILGALGQKRGLCATLPVQLAGQFFNQVLPTSIGGDAMRIWLAYRDGLSGRISVASVMIDRAVGLLSLCILITATLPLLLRLIPSGVLLGGVLLLLSAGYGGTGIAMILDRVSARFAHYRLVRAIAAISAGLRLTLLSPRPALAGIGHSLVFQLGAVTAVYFLARGLGLSASALTCLVIVPIASLATLLPISVGGWGLREGAFAVGFGLVGIARADAIALSVFFGLIAMLVSLPGGLVWLVRRDEQEARAPS